MAQIKILISLQVHGGAGNSKPETFESRLNGVIKAAKKGYQQLIKSDQSSNHALNAVVDAAVRIFFFVFKIYELIFYLIGYNGR